ncbi:MAG: putative hemolysin [Sphingobacteriales bacterium]|jgi:putative hemolysin
MLILETLPFFSPDLIGISISTIILLFLSAVFSGSEVAFFSITPREIKELRAENPLNPDKIIILLSRPKRLLATILICNNLVNIGIVLLSSVLVSRWLDPMGLSPTNIFLIQVVAVTFIILLVGEIIPKVFANRNNMRIAKLMVVPMQLLNSFFLPLSKLLVNFSNIIDKRVSERGSNHSVEELEQAMELTLGNHAQNSEEKKILKGVVKFGSTEVKQIMTSRTNIESISEGTPFKVLITKVLSYGYSRIPVVTDNLDSIKGILHIKDLLPHLEKDDFNWEEQLRQPFFVSENKKISELLKEFQDQKQHMAIAVDEYGGTSGVITLEDVIEEIVGDISDEFDEEDVIYSKIDEKTFIFEAKTSLVDLYRILNISGENFEIKKGESGSLGGFLIEQLGKIPKKGDTIKFDGYQFIIDSANQRKITRVKVICL